MLPAVNNNSEDYRMLIVNIAGCGEWIVSDVDTECCGREKR